MKRFKMSLIFLLSLLGYPKAISQPNATAFADIILVNGHVWTGESQSSFADAVAIRGNKVTQVGTSSDIRAKADGHTQIIDLQGRLVTPGFNDAHIHFLSGAMGIFEVDLTDAKTIEEVITRIGNFARENPTREWITGRGWQYTMFHGGLPTRQMLDAIVKDRPVFIKAYDGHSAWVNSNALERARINASTRFSDYGEIVRNPQGELTGALKEGAQDLVSRIIPAPTRAEKLKALRQGIKLATTLGITSIQNASGSPEEFSLYEELNQNGELTLRISTAFSVSARTTPAEIEEFAKLKNRSGKNPLLQAPAVKFMLDGVIESHTGAMLEPYSDLSPNERSPTGELGLPLELYRSLVVKFDKLGFTIYTHAIGDRAVREALNAYENAREINKNNASRHRIEHIEMIATTDMPRFARLGVMASMEPIHAEPGTSAVWSRAVGEKRLPNAFAWSSLLQNKAHIVFSSDWPACVSLDPIRGLHTAVTRRSRDGKPLNGWVPEQKISIGDALLAYTTAGAFSSYEEDTKGKIAPGYVADLAVFSMDLFKIEPMETHESKVVMTIFDGKIIYQNKDF